ncbi:MAG: phenylacetate--CoA ligase family protein [Desulfuromonadales bacterium]|nr:phenylacetate--CoA ligase family protein [Desulfuromonadales bacterium]
MSKLTPLEPWITGKIGVRAGNALTRAALEKFQLARLGETVDYVKRHSPFYQQRLAGYAPPASWEELSAFPFTTPSDLQENDHQFLCVSLAEIERIVTLQSSGSTAPPKRVHFTAADLELTIDFFHHGMATLVQPGQKVLILMPGEQPGSVGDLLKKGLARLGVTSIIHGLVRDAEETLRTIETQEIDCLVGLPVQLLSLARHPSAALIGPNRIKSILVSADFASPALVNALNSAWGAPVIDHYGMTEMGLGGGVECRHCCGYHLREADLYVEIIDPLSGHPLPDGELGEVVFTTLTRRGMPLVRYRTGDQARFLKEPCPCGTVLRRMERVQGRMAGSVLLAKGVPLNITELDQVLFPLPFLLDYQAVISSRNNRDALAIGIETYGADADQQNRTIHHALMALPSISAAVSSGDLALDPVSAGKCVPSATIKRSIIDLRKE